MTDYQQAPSVREAIDNAPSPATMAQIALEHLNGDGKKKISYGMSCNMKDNTCDLATYLCWVAGLQPVLNVNQNTRLSVPTGYVTAEDGSAELATRVAKTLLGGYSEHGKFASYLLTGIREIVTGSDGLHLFETNSRRPKEDAKHYQDPEDLEITQFNRPAELEGMLRAIIAENPPKAEYVPFVAVQRPDHYAMSDQLDEL